MHVQLKRVANATALALAAVGVTSHTAAAQTARGGTGTITAARAPRAAMRSSSCAELNSMPTVLTMTPEGRSVVKLQRELETVAQLQAQRGENMADLRTIVSVQKGVDSLMQIIVRHLNDVEGRATIVVRDSAGRTEFENKLTRSQIEAQIRELQPKVAALAGSFVNSAAVGVTASTGGWIGMHISGSFVRELSPAGVVTRYCDDYPVIEAVDAGSPAEKGGLQSGDTLLAFNNRDVLTQPFIFSQLFVAGQQLRVKVRRVGRTREVPIVVAEPRPMARVALREPLIANCGRDVDCARMMRDSVMTFRFTKDIPAPASVMLTAPSVSMFMRDGNVTLVGGAQMTVVGEELARSLGVSEGLLVVRVLDGTPLADAGVRVGEVIRQVNGEPARDIGVVQRGLAARTREMRLLVGSRSVASRVVVVKW